VNQLKPRVAQDLTSEAEMAGVDRETGPPFRDPFVIHGRDRGQPARALAQRLRPQARESFVAFADHLGMKGNRFGLDAPEALRRGTHIFSPVPEPSAQCSCAIVSRIREHLERSVKITAAGQPRAKLKEPPVSFVPVRYGYRPSKCVHKLGHAADRPSIIREIRRIWKVPDLT
jgi:hypothetical protein